MPDIIVPSLGESVSEATVARWLKKEGDAVQADEPIVELETDKVTLEVNAAKSGVIASIAVAEGESVEVGTVLGVLEEGASASSKPAPASTAAKNTPSNTTDQEDETIDITVPSLGESVAQATISRWLKKVGDTVALDESLVELETDKATMEVNAPKAGVITAISAQEGSDVEVGAIIGQLSIGGTASASSSAAAPAASAPAANKSANKLESKSDDKSDLSPAVRKMVADHDLDASKIAGTGKDGRILKEDVQNFMDKKPSSSAPAAAPTQSAPSASHSSADKSGREERVKMTKLRQSIAKRLKEAQNTAAMLSTFNEVDMTAIMKIRNDHKDAFEKKHGIKLGFMSFFAKAVVAALKDFPAVNAEIDGDEIVYKNYYDISVAVSTPQGLVVPVIRDCDGKSMADIEKNLVELGTKAREGKLSIQDMMGGTFTITNGGVFGSLMSMPIINPPQSGILGMHKIQQRPMVMPDGSIQARPMMYITLSYDHRIIDGKEGVSFLVAVKNAIEDPQRLLLDI